MRGPRRVRTVAGTLVLAASVAACEDDPTGTPLDLDLPAAEARKGGGNGPPGTGGGDPVQDDFTAWNPDRWTEGDHPLGKGSFRPENVSVADDLLKLRLPADTYDGGEIRSAERLRWGTYEARIRVADAPGSIATFFLYEYTRTNNDEVDIEIFGDGSRRVMFTTWVRGRQTNHVVVVLPFDPSAGFHDYRIEWSPGAVRFAVDGVTRAEFTDGIPSSAMYVMANAWWPVWLDGPTPSEDRTSDYDWIRHP